MGWGSTWNTLPLLDQALLTLSPSLVGQLNPSDPSKDFQSSVSPREPFTGTPGTSWAPLQTSQPYEGRWDPTGGLQSSCTRDRYRMCWSTFT